MDLIICPTCQQENQTNAAFCGNCGSNLKDVPRTESKPIVQNTMWQDQPQPVLQQGMQRPSAYAPTLSPAHPSSRKYASLQGIAALCSTLAIGVLVLAGLGVLGGLLVMTDSFIAGLGAIFVVAISATPIYVFLRVISESIFVILDIEANTRNSSISLERVEKLLGNVAK